ncbi:hypothetical protein AB0M43_30755 [Longispora sp. NPDC051575]|uniref:hypothetical protein n=1 Tax=Longispora sp. NPDC051575 TaxID=3154943 RepID=UPI0034242A6F
MKRYDGHLLVDVDPDWFRLNRDHTTDPEPFADWFTERAVNLHDAELAEWEDFTS